MAKPAITKRTTKAAALTYAELDGNFQNLQDATLTIQAGTAGTNVVADLNGTITLVAGTGVTLTGDNAAKTVTINSSAGGGTADSTTYLTIGDAGTNTFIKSKGTDSLRLSADPALGYVEIDYGGSVLVNAYNGFTQTGRFDLGSTYTGTTASTINSKTINTTGQNFSVSSSIATTITSGSSVLEVRASGTSQYTTIGALRLQAGGGNAIRLDSVVRLSSTTSASIASPENGYIVYDTATNKFQGYANGAWVDLH